MLAALRMNTTLRSAKDSDRTVLLLWLSILTIYVIPLGVLAQQRAATPKPPSPDNQYVLGPDSQPQAGVPEGKITAFTLPNSRTYPGFQHKWWLYIPAQYDGKKTAPLMIFQDGEGYVRRDVGWHVPVVLDNLIEKKQLPVMVAVFVEPGEPFVKPSDAKALASAKSLQRSIEYDTLSAAYATFLLKEILPEVRKHVRITNNPEGHGIGGHSSGGICAFTVAWQRPDQFRKVFSANGSFVNIRGGNAYPEIVRHTKRKPIRIFQQDGARDTVQGYESLSWPEGNKALAAALDEKGYDHKWVFGEGTHRPRHAAAIFPEVMRWLWRDYQR